MKFTGAVDRQMVFQKTNIRCTSFLDAMALSVPAAPKAPAKLSHLKGFGDSRAEICSETILNDFSLNKRPR